jgi:hypothetical protein
MKTFSDEALAALQRGDAIVSASVEIIPSSAISYSTVGIYDISATTDVSTTAAGGLSVGVLVSGFDPLNHARFTLPSGQTFEGWRSATSPAIVYQNAFDAILDEDSARSFRVSDAGTSTSSTLHVAGYATPTAARESFGSQTLTGASTYRLYILDSPTADNALGVSVRVERGILVAGAGDPIRLWGGYGAADLPSDEGTSTFQGIGDRGLVQQTTASIGGSAQNLTLSLSGIEPAALEVLDPSEVKGAAAVVRRLIFDSAGKTLLGAYVYTRGRVDELKTSEVVGGSASIQLSIEGAARGLGRRGGRIRSDADQRIVNSTDGFYRVVSAAPKKMLYWGGKKPALGSQALSSGGGGGGSTGTTSNSV